MSIPDDILCYITTFLDLHTDFVEVTVDDITELPYNCCHAVLPLCCSEESLLKLASKMPLRSLTYVDTLFLSISAITILFDRGLHPLDKHVSDPLPSYLLVQVWLQQNRSPLISDVFLKQLWRMYQRDLTKFEKSTH